jgi:shikimate dehydrogenase
MHALGDRLGVKVATAPWDRAAEAFATPLTISTTPVGATDSLSAGVPQAPGALFDVLYHPWPTALAQAWAQRGGIVLGGLDLLVHQAVLQFEMFTGVSPAPLAAMRAAGEAALAGRP